MMGLGNSVCFLRCRAMIGTYHRVFLRCAALIALCRALLAVSQLTFHGHHRVAFFPPALFRIQRLGKSS